MTCKIRAWFVRELSGSKSLKSIMSPIRERKTKLGASSSSKTTPKTCWCSGNERMTLNTNHPFWFPSHALKPVHSLARYRTKKTGIFGLSPLDDWDPRLNSSTCRCVGESSFPQEVTGLAVGLHPLSSTRMTLVNHLLWFPSQGTKA